MMKRALIDGTRIAQVIDPVTESEFDVAPPLYWSDVPDDTTDHDTYVAGSVVKTDVLVASASIEEALSRKKDALAGIFKRVRDGGIMVTITGVPISISTTHNAQQELREVVMRLAGGGTQKGVTRSGAPILFTEAIAQQCLDAVHDHHSDCNDAEYDHFVAVLALTTISEIDAYDVTTGWPGIP